MFAGMVTQPDPSQRAAAPFYWPVDNVARRQLAASLLVLAFYVVAEVFAFDPGGAVEWRGPAGWAHLATSIALAPVFRGLAFSIPALLILLVALLIGPRGELARSILPGEFREVAAISILAALAFLFFNSIQLWPFTWRSGISGTRAVASSYLAGGHYLALLIWAVWIVVAIPVVEEVAFRYGLLRYLAWKSNSVRVGILGSSLVFALGHLGNVLAIDGAHVRNATGIFVLAVFLGAQTAKRGGNIGIAIALHMTRNGVEFATLLAVSVR